MLSIKVGWTLVFQENFAKLKISPSSLKKYYHLLVWCLKLVSTIFYQVIVSHQIILFLTLQKLWKMFFISSKNLFSFLRCSNYLSSPLFIPVRHCFRGWLKINLKVCDVINCLNINNTFCLISWKRKKVWHWKFVHW